MNDGQLAIGPRTSAFSALTVAVLAGFVASVAMVLAFAVAFVAALGLGRLPIAFLASWFQGLTRNALIDTAGPNLYTATAIFFVGGLCWALVYGLLAEPRLHGPGWRRGVEFALVPWLVSLAVFMPLVGGGILGLGLGAGPLPLLGNLILHVIYGALLGTIYASAEAVWDQPLHRGDSADVAAGRISELGAARGVVVGLVIGVLLGIVGAALVPQGMDIHPLAMVVAVSLTGAGFGGLVGSLVAL